MDRGRNWIVGLLAILAIAGLVSSGARRATAR